MAKLTTLRLLAKQAHCNHAFLDSDTCIHCKLKVEF